MSDIRHGDVESGAAFAALVAFTVIMLLSPQTWFPALAPLRIAFIAGGAAAAFLLWDRWSRRDRLLKLKSEMVIVIVLLSWVLLTLPLSFWPGGSVKVLTDSYLKAVLLFWLLANIITTAERLRFISVALILCTVPLTTTAIKNFATGRFLAASDPMIGRIQGYQAALASNPNDLALMLNLILPLGIAMFLSATRPFLRVLCLVVIAINVVGVIVTFSRAGFLGLATIAGIYFIKLVRRPGRDRGFAFAMLLLLIVSLPLLPSSYIGRIATITDIDADRTGSAQSRWRDSVAAARFVMEHPIVGAGLGMDTLALNQVRGMQWKQVHNVYLQHAVDLGLPGLILFLMLIYAVLRAVRSAQLRSASTPSRDLFYLSEGLQVSLIVFVVAGMFHPVAYHFYFYYMAGLALAARAATENAMAIA